MDPLLLPMAQSCIDCYVDGVAFSWQNDLKLAHLIQSDINGVVTFAFAGTINPQEWLVNLFALQTPVSDHPVLGLVHDGFLVDAQEAVTSYIYPTLKALNFPPFYITGHSKGAAEAILTHALLKSLGHTPTATRVFEPPRVGGSKLCDFLAQDDLVWTQTRNAHITDIITLVPFGPSWSHGTAPVILTADDHDDMITLHKMPQVISSLKMMAG